MKVKIKTADTQHFVFLFEKNRVKNDFFCA